MTQEQAPVKHYSMVLGQTLVGLLTSFAVCDDEEFTHVTHELDEVTCPQCSEIANKPMDQAKYDAYAGAIYAAYADAETTFVAAGSLDANEDRLEGWLERQFDRLDRRLMDRSETFQMFPAPKPAQGDN